MNPDILKLMAAYGQFMPQMAGGMAPGLNNPSRPTNAPTGAPNAVPQMILNRARQGMIR
jgi:hypothetical protein